jgi:hypothetical protein
MEIYDLCGLPFDDLRCVNDPGEISQLDDLRRRSPEERVAEIVDQLRFSRLEEDIWRIPTGRETLLFQREFPLDYLIQDLISQFREVRSLKETIEPILDEMFKDPKDHTVFEWSGTVIVILHALQQANCNPDYVAGLIDVFADSKAAWVFRIRAFARGIRRVS